MTGRFLKTALYWSVPPLVCLIVYWPGLLTWFQDDDFAFLGILSRIHSWGDLFSALFRPTVHGTWRPLSDRGYFLSLQSLFGINPLPFHIVAFLTQFANLALLAAITRRLTASMAAGFAAAILWVANSKLILAMSWCSAYDYPMCGFFLLTAFWLFLRWTDTGKRGYAAGMWAVYLLGFGVLETNIVFPLLIGAYTLLCARARFRKTLALFVPSILFVTLDFLLVHKQASGPYKMHFTTAMIKTFGRYWAWAFEPLNLTAFTHLPENAGVAGMVLFSVALLGFAGYQAFRRNLLPAFFLCWFVIVLLPVLPLRDNVQDLYLTLPVIGLAMLGAYAFTWASKKPLLYRSVAAVLFVFFLIESVPTARGGTEWYLQRSRKVEALVKGVVSLHALRPGKAILLTGIDGPLFEASIAQHPFYAFEIPDVFLAPGSDAQIAPGNPGAIAGYIFPADRAAGTIARGEAVVLEWHDGKLTDITSTYSPPQAEAVITMQQRVDVGDPRFERQLGPEWYAIDGGFRWMPKRASVMLPGPVLKGKKLVVSGYCPAPQVAQGPLGMIVSVDGARLAAVHVDKGDAPFSFEFGLAEDAHSQIKVEVEVDRTFSTAADHRGLGLAFGVFEIR